MEVLTMLTKPLPSPEYLRQRLRYDAETGKLYWRYHPAMSDGWNTRWAAREAFTALKGKGYRVGRVDGCLLRAHRVIWVMTYGYWPVEIDHEDHDVGNNRLLNLRDRDRARNARNLPLYKSNRSGVMGVNWDARAGLWRAEICVADRRTTLGRFARFEDAVAARAAAEIKHGFHANHGAA
jgi:hypothetical protein